MARERPETILAERYVPKVIVRMQVPGAGGQAGGFSQLGVSAISRCAPIGFLLFR